MIEAELIALGWDQTYQGVLALGMARGLDEPGLPHAGLASLTKGLGALMDEIKSQAPREPDEIDTAQDELARRRAEAGA